MMSSFPVSSNNRFSQIKSKHPPNLSQFGSTNISDRDISLQMEGPTQQAKCTPQKMLYFTLVQREREYLLSFFLFFLFLFSFWNINIKHQPNLELEFAPCLCTQKLCKPLSIIRTLFSPNYYRRTCPNYMVQVKTLPNSHRKQRRTRGRKKHSESDRHLGLERQNEQSLAMIALVTCKGIFK